MAVGSFIEWVPPGYDEIENRHLNPCTFFHQDSLLYHQAARYSREMSTLNLKGQLRGKGYMKKWIIGSPTHGLFYQELSSPGKSIGNSQAPVLPGSVCTGRKIFA